MSLLIKSCYDFIFLPVHFMLVTIHIMLEKIWISKGVIMADNKTNVSLLVSDNRKTGIARCIDTLMVNPVTNKHVLIKPNFNTANPGSCSCPVNLSLDTTSRLHVCRL